MKMTVRAIICWLSLFHCFHERVHWTLLEFYIMFHLTHMSSVPVNNFIMYCTYLILSSNSLRLMLVVVDCATQNKIYLILHVYTMHYGEVFTIFLIEYGLFCLDILYATQNHGYRVGIPKSKHATWTITYPCYSAEVSVDVTTAQLEWVVLCSNLCDN